MKSRSILQRVIFRRIVMCECIGRIACEDEMSIWLEDDNYLLAICDAQGYYGEVSVKINYCPMCGRKLEEE